MNKARALLITEDRIENMEKFTPSNASEAYIAKETLEWLYFIKNLLTD